MKFGPCVCGEGCRVGKKKVVYVQKRRMGCLWACLALVTVCLAIYAVMFALCVAAGVGLWFLVRMVWRSLVREKPESKFVERGMGMAPVTRKALAAIPCALLSLCLTGALGGTTSGTKAPDGGSAAASVASTTSPAPATSQAATTSQAAATDAATSAATEAQSAEESATAALDLSNIPAYSGSPYVRLADAPAFTDEEKARSSFEDYSQLDSLGRCGVAFALIGTETMPTEERGSIGMVKPSGWHTVRYDGVVDGKYLYNRCHLIGYQLAGENANPLNLITGTRYLNVEGMLPFEDEVAAYVERTNNHVLYRVTPVFEGQNLVASGVRMEAWSVEDAGAGVSFDVYCYNVQPGITIDYATGDSELAEDAQADAGGDGAAGEASGGSSDAGSGSSDETQQSYVLNTNTMKFHRPGCSSVSTMKAKNRQDFTGTRQELIDKGYSPCGKCNP